MGQSILIKRARLSYPHLYAKHAFDEKQEPKYKARFVVEKGSEEDKQIQKAINEAAKEVFGAKAAAVLESIKGNNMKYVYADGALSDDEGLQDCMILSASNKNVRPLLLDGKKQKLPDTDTGVLYAGCYVAAKVEIYASKDYKGIFATVTGVMFVGDGPAFSGGRPAAEDDFAELSVVEDDLDDIL
jgi:hypothetical protein